MGNYTDELNLYVTDMETDGNDYFNFKRDLDDNWVKIDNFARDVNSKLSLRYIGEIVKSILPIKDSGLHLLDGSLLQGEGIYKGFVENVAELYADNPNANYFTTENAWQLSVSVYGVCAKFVYDSVNNTVRLPKITGIIEGTTDINALGDLIEAGLPQHAHSASETGNHQHTFTTDLAGEHTHSTTESGDHVHSIPQGSSGGGHGGAEPYTSGDDYTGTIANWVSSSAGGNHAHIALSAGAHSHSGATSLAGIHTHAIGYADNTVYGKSAKVQPQTIKVLYYIVVATSAKSDIQVDIDNIASDLNVKMDNDLSNITQNGKTSITNYPMPSSIYTDITLGASGAMYIAPANGWVNLAFLAATSCQLYNISGGSFFVSSYAANNEALGIYLPVKKGDTFQAYYTMTTFRWFRFYYCSGET